MWSDLLDTALITLRYLAPLTFFLLLLNNSYVLEAFGHLREFARSFARSNDDKTESVLQWLSAVSPIRVTKLDQVWRHGWLLCEALNQALPGACKGHVEGDISIEHAQALCEQYLGIAAIFRREDFACATLRKRHRRELLQYLVKVRQSLARLSPVVTRSYTRTHNESQAYTLDYVARGPGLAMAQANKKISFKIYPTAQQCLEPAEIYISIVGPDQKFGKTVIPPIFGRAQLLRQAFLGASLEYTEISLPLTQGASYLRQYRRNDMNKTFFIPKQAIDIETRVRKDHAIVTYTPTMEGFHEITITSNGYNLVGSPFRVNASEDSIDDASTSSSEINEESEMEVTEIKKERKIVLRIVDFVTEKMIMNENGTLVKISEEEANALMKNEITENPDNQTQVENESKSIEKKPVHLECSKFKDTSKKIMKILDVCNILKASLNKDKESVEQEYPIPKNCDIPDILNSMIFYRTRNSSYTDDCEDNNFIDTIKEDDATKCLKNSNENCNFDKSETVKSHNLLEDVYGTNPISNVFHVNNNHTNPASSATNPFLYDTKIADFMTEEINIYNGNNPFLADYETENYNNKRNQNSVDIEIAVDCVGDDMNNFIRNPFIVANEPERPKTPILKILNDDIDKRPDANFIDPNYDYQHNNCSDDYTTEYLNPFYVSKICQNIKDDLHTPKTDFQIGAPVSSTYTVSYSPVPDMDSIILAPNLEEALEKYNKKVETLTLEDNFIPPTPIHKATVLTDFFDESNISSSSNNILNVCNDFAECKNAMVKTSNKTVWDSAYVSIDEQNNTLETKQNNSKKNSRTPTPADITTNSCDVTYLKQLEDSKDNYSDKDSDLKFNNVISEIKHKNSTYSHNIEPDLVQISAAHSIISAFSELNDIYRNYVNTDDNNSFHETTEKENFNSIEVNFAKHISDHVDSASDCYSDVKRHSDSILAKSISEVQSNSAESPSVSRAHIENSKVINTNIPEWDDQKMFGENLRSFVSESKKFWDAKIKASQEIKQQEERSWNQVIKQSKATHTCSNETKSINRNQIVKCNQKFEHPPELKDRIKLVPKWKNYWDDVLRDIEKTEPNNLKKINTSSESSRFDKCNGGVNIKKCQRKHENETINDKQNDKNPEINTSMKSSDHACEPCETVTNNNFKIEDLSENLPNMTSTECIKDVQVTDEELFEAFETSPKRFFGKSRSNIFGKIDSINKIPEKDEVESSNSDFHGISIVSNRISMLNLTTISSERTDIKNNNYTGKINLSLDNLSKKLAFKDEESVKSSNCDGDNLTATVCNNQDTNKISVLKLGTESVLKSNHQSITQNKKKDEIEVKCLKNSKLKSKSDISIKVDCNTGNNHVNKIDYAKNTQEYNISKLHQCNDVKTDKNEINILKHKFKSEANISNFHQEETEVDKSKSVEDVCKVNVRNHASILKPVTEILKYNEDRLLHTKKIYKNELACVNNAEIMSVGGVCINNESNINDNTIVNESHDTKNVHDNDISKFNPHNNVKNGDIINFKNNLNPKFKSEANISKLHQNESEVNKIKSVEDLYTVSVRNYISIFEKSAEVDKTAIKSKSQQSVNHSPTKSIVPHQLQKVNVFSDVTESINSEKSKSQETAKGTDLSSEKTTKKTIILKKSDDSNEIDDENYRERFCSVKNFFKTLETSKCDCKEPKKLNECELILHSSESQTKNQSTFKREDTIRTEQEKKLTKVSEKFQVEDLFNDIAGDSKLRRSRSFRGIPRRKAVLDTFKSMENIANISSYDINDSEFLYITKDSLKTPIYSNEYPYLPQTEPSECSSRFDKEAIGLITRKELLKQCKKIRRVSAPNMSRLNEKFPATM